jgi:hypothetical protein
MLTETEMKQVTRHFEPERIQFPAEVVRDALRRSSPVGIAYQPGNGTQYDLVFTPAWMLDDEIAMRFGYADRVDGRFVPRTEFAAVVAHVNRGTCAVYEILRADLVPDYDTIAEQLCPTAGRPNLADGVAVWTLFKAIADA